MANNKISITVSNGGFKEISPYYQSTAKGDFDINGDICKIISPLFEELVPGTPVTVTDDKGKTYDKKDIANQFILCCGDVMNTDAEDIVEGFVTNTMRYYTPSLCKEIFLSQAATKEKLPIVNALYTIKTDVIPVCKDFIAGNCTDDFLQASMGFALRANTLGLYFVNEMAFDKFKETVKARFAAISSATTISIDVSDKFNDLQTIKLDGTLLETIKIRNDSDDDNDELSFSRLFHSIIMSTVKVAGISGIIPFNLEQLVCPTYISFINISEHARSKPNRISKAWQELSDFQSLPYNIISKNKLNKMSSISRAKSNAAMAVALAQKSKDPDGKSMAFVFGSKQPTTKMMIKYIVRILHKMKNTAKSDNMYKTEHMTFARANRRHPDDPNFMGKSSMINYHPDIHLYIDTSGSITKDNYEAMVKSCIALAQKLNVNMYFNSFSHCMSETTKLHIRDRSKKQIYKEFERVPKVTGGTDYLQIWNFINSSSKRRGEFSIILSDFEWCPPTKAVRHPKNLYYVPCLNMNWTEMVHAADSFCHSMYRIDNNIRDKVLM